MPMRFIAPYALLIIWALLLLLLPPVAAWLGGHDLGEYLRFPLTQRSWDSIPLNPRVYAFSTGLAVVSLVLMVMLGTGSAAKRAEAMTAADSKAFPRWGRPGMICVPAGMALAGAAYSAAGLLMSLAGLVVLLNADLLRRTGHSLMTERAGYFVILFAGGLLLGWLMHYLNLFLQNWTYPGLDPLDTVIFTLGLSLHYALLLPLLLSLRQWLASHPRLLRHVSQGRSFSPKSTSDHGILILGLGMAGLIGAGLWPDRIYPLSWAAPLLVATGLTMANGRQTLFSGIRHGNWSRVLLTGFAALLLTLLELAWSRLFGPDLLFSFSLLHTGAAILPPPAVYVHFMLLGLTGLWVADQLITPWRQRPKKRFPDFPLQIRIQ